MSKIKVLSTLVVVLLILNVGLMGFMLTKGAKHSNKHHKPRHHHSPKEMIIEKLSFNQEQVILYEETIDNHRNSIAELENQIQDAKKELYSNLTSVEDAPKEYLDKLTKLQTEIEKTHFEHFVAIKMICEGDQLAKYDELTNELAKIFGKPKGKKGHRR